jgi:hypothetical protein
MMGLVSLLCCGLKIPRTEKFLLMTSPALQVQLAGFCCVIFGFAGLKTTTFDFFKYQISPTPNRFGRKQLLIS